MKVEAQNRAIAEACGWVAIRQVLFNGSTPEYVSVGYSPRNPFPHEKGEEVITDFVNDLNAMSESEKHLVSIERLSEYADQLDKVCVPTHICALTHWQSVAMATAAQRAEAFLRTIGKWVEE